MLRRTGHRSLGRGSGATGEAALAPVDCLAASCCKGRRQTMPLIQGGPPEWIWERTPEQLQWEIVTSDRPEGQRLYELRVNCGLEIMRLQFFTRQEMQKLASLLAEDGSG